MLKFTRNSVIAFDFHEALSFEGETGPYVQYASVRAANILRKFVDRGERAPRFCSSAYAGIIRRAFWKTKTYGSCCCWLRKPIAPLRRAVASGEPAHVAKYAFQLAQAFNNFYHGTSVIAEEDAERRNVLLWLTDYVRAQLLVALQVLGIEQPLYM